MSGLLVPARVTFYAGWNPDDPGEGATFTVEDAVLGTTPPDPAIYVPPADAVVGDGPSGP